MVTTTSALIAVEEVLSKSGATLPSLDPIDDKAKTVLGSIAKDVTVLALSSVGLAGWKYRFIII